MSETVIPCTTAAPHRALTSVRFLAALWVLLFHAIGVMAPLPPFHFIVKFTSLGYVAVSFFFLLSGYILAVSYLGIPRPVASPKTFLVNRFARIYPLYLLTLMMDTPDWFVAHASSFGGYRHAIMPTLATVLEHVLMLQAWLPWQRGIDRPNWSLSVEAFLYLLFPFVAIKLWRLSSNASLAAVGLLYSGGLGFIWITGADFSPLHMSIDSRMFLPISHVATFFIGIAIARWQHQCRAQLDHWSSAQSCLLFSAGIGGVAALLYLSNRFATPEVYRNSGLLAVAFALILVALSLEGRLPARVLGVGWLESLGHASYSLYLLQVPILHLLQRADRHPSWLLFATYITICIGMSLLSFRFIEVPLRAAILRNTGPRILVR